MFSQISSLRAVPTETWAAIAAIAGAGAVLAKKLLTRKPKPDLVTRAEFHDGLDKVRDRIGASYLALAQKIDQQHNTVLTKLDHQGATFERRLDQLDATVARLDERTNA